MNEPDASIAVAVDKDEDLEFKYTSAHQAPEAHRTIAIQYAMGADVMMIAGSVGYEIAYIEKILRHPPLHEIISGVRESLDRAVVSQLQEWTSMLPEAIKALKDSLASPNERVKLTAATEYLDRHPSGVFIKRKSVDASSGRKVMNTDSIEELKRNAVNAAKAEGARNVRAIAAPEAGPEAGPGASPVQNSTAGSEAARAAGSDYATNAGEDGPSVGGSLESGHGIGATKEAGITATGSSPGSSAVGPAEGGAEGGAEGSGTDDAEGGWGDRDGAKRNGARDDLDEYDPL